MQLNSGNYKATVTGGFVTEKGDAVGLRVSIGFEDGTAQDGTAYLNFINRDGSNNQQALETALSIFSAGQPGGLDANTWDNFETVIQSMVDVRAVVDVRAYNNKLYVQTGSGVKQLDPSQSAAAKRNLAMLTRCMATTAVPAQQPATAGPRVKLIEELTKMRNAGQDFTAYTGGKKVKDMSDVEVDAVLAKIANGPDLTPPTDDIPF